MQPHTVRQLVEIHELFWRDQETMLSDLRKSYLHEFWDSGRRDAKLTADIYVETSKSYEFIEGYIASLFSRNPSINTQAGMQPGGDSEKVQDVANSFLSTVRSQLEDLSRLALIYPMAFLKLSMEKTEFLEDLVSISTVPPWHVIVDRDANSWEQQRFYGHIYWLSYSDAKEIHGNKDYSWTDKESYWRDEDEEANQTPDINMFKYIKVVELYDLQNDKLFLWSPNYADGNKYLSKTDIPFRDNRGRPIQPIIPLYYSRKPDKPLDGYSALRRIYDDVEEMNYTRTYQANAVRKAARQWIVKKGAFTQSQLDRLTSGVDGVFIETDEDDVRKCISPVPHTPTPPELEHHFQAMQSDADRGNIMAPFTRGQATKATATEVSLQAQYTASEVGRLAREKDALIENLASTYIELVAWYLRNNTDISRLVVINGKADSISEDDLTGDFRFYSEDSGQTPMSLSAKKNEILTLIPMLSELGVSAEELLKHVVGAYSLPDTMAVQAKAEAPAPQMPQQPEGMMQ